MVAVQRWTGQEARALRVALRFSVRGFAEHLGISARAVSKWEAGGLATVPRPVAQAMLDTVLGRTDGAARERFELLCRANGVATTAPMTRPQFWEYETWADDLERAAVALSYQDFEVATSLAERWFTRFPLVELDERGRYLHARSLVIQGSVRRDQGRLAGPRSARRSFTAAREMFLALDSPRRTAQADLGLAVLDEMGGGLESSARSYAILSQDPRLSERDRALAELWVGTALSKVGREDSTARAIEVMMSASRMLERLDEAPDWAIAQQKLALAFRGRGDLDRAMSFIDLAERNRVGDSPLQRVRLSTARAHILLSDPQSQTEGMNNLERAESEATGHGLQHQLDSIRRIQATARRN